MAIVRSKTLWIVMSVLCVAVAALLMTNMTRGAIRDVSWKQSDWALGQPNLYQDPVEELSLTLTTSGFTPAELRPHGKKFLLSLDNRTDVKELVLRMSRNDGVQIREIRVPGGSGDWSELFELQAGNYTFSEGNHENWLCTIIISE